MVEDKCTGRAAADSRTAPGVARYQAEQPAACMPVLAAAVDRTADRDSRVRPDGLHLDAGNAISRV